ncbi:MAG: hypothetical protein M1469_09330 [Bacteroidetes bacterium]|nr:hypothetical protein [Bacteroidota bacterium]
MTGRSFIFARLSLLSREQQLAWPGIALPTSLCTMLIALFSCCSQPISPDDLLVSSCRFEPPLFDSFRQNTKLSYSLNQPATVSVNILDQDRNVVKTVAVDLSLSKGSHSHGWKGDNDEWTFVPTGIYIGQVIAKGKKFEATVEVFHW